MQKPNDKTNPTGQPARGKGSPSVQDDKPTTCDRCGMILTGEYGAGWVLCGRCWREENND